MKLTSGIFFTWEEVNEALQTVLDDKTVDVRHEDGTYGAYSEDSGISLDMGQVDARLAQYIGWDCESLPDSQNQYVGYACVFGLILVSQRKEGEVWLPAPTEAVEVAVVVEGGMVQSVYASDGKTCVSVLDMDTNHPEAYEELEKEREELQTRIDGGKLHQVY